MDKAMALLGLALQVAGFAFMWSILGGGAALAILVFVAGRALGTSYEMKAMHRAHWEHFRPRSS